MNEVTAVMQRLAKPMLSEEHFSQFREKWPEIAVCFQGAKAYDSARGRLETGEGIGEPLIRIYLGGGVASSCPRSNPEIRDAVAAVKASGIYPKIVAAATAEIRLPHPARGQSYIETTAEAAVAAARLVGDFDPKSRAHRARPHRRSD
jgi:imidazolonepropionase-like amidohydrolase